MEGRRRAEVALAQISTGDFDLPSSVSCRRRSFRSTTSSNRVRCRWNASMHRSGVGDWSRRRWKTRRAIRAGALVLAEDHAELNGIAVGIPPGILWEREKHHCDLLEVEAALGLSADVHSYALLPIGYPMGRFGPVRRVPITDVVYEDQWGQPYRDQ